MRYLTAAALFLLLVVPALSAEIDGKWTATIDGMDGNKMELTYLFKAEGTKITGSVTSSMGEMKITEGKIEGNKISFTVASDQFSIANTGTISGDEIKLNADMGGQVTPILVKRVK